MTKVVVFALFLMFCGYVVASNPGGEYWENIGPRWDKMLNPCDYGNC